LDRITRRMLVDSREDDGPPRVPHGRGPSPGMGEFGPVATTGDPEDPKSTAMHITHNPWANASQREAARLDYLKAQAKRKKPVRRAKV